MRSKRSTVKEKSVAKEVSVELWLLVKAKLSEELIRELFKHNTRRGKIKSGTGRRLLNLIHPLHLYLFKPPGFHVSSAEQSVMFSLHTCYPGRGSKNPSFISFQTLLTSLNKERIHSMLMSISTSAPLLVHSMQMFSRQQAESCSFPLCIVAHWDFYSSTSAPFCFMLWQPYQKSLTFELFQNLNKGTTLPWLHNLFTAVNNFDHFGM